LRKAVRLRNGIYLFWTQEAPAKKGRCDWLGPRKSAGPGNPTGEAELTAATRLDRAEEGKELGTTTVGMAKVQGRWEPDENRMGRRPNPLPLEQDGGGQAWWIIYLTKTDEVV